MKGKSRASFAGDLGVSALLLAIGLSCGGCQTFSLTKTEWEQQQRGGVVDKEVGDAVSVLGSLGYCGAAVAGAVKAATK